MSTPRFHIDGPIPESGSMELPRSVAHHINAVLRMKAGATIILFNGRGGEYQAQIINTGNHQAEVRILDYRNVEREISWPLCLALCVSKGSKMDLCVQKATELGVSRIQPLISARSVVRLDAQRAARRTRHWREVVISASEQSGRNRLAEVATVAGYETWLATEQISGLKLLLTPGAEPALAHCEPPGTAGLWLLIGPEGGFTQAELAAAISRGFQAVSFGGRILRAETATIASLAAVQALWGETP